jgi:large subunit ribosomal protein L4
MAPLAKTTGSRRASGVRAPVLGKTSKADLPPTVFGEEFHESLVHETARADLAARRRGTASTLGRGEVSMTTAKAWRQKGTGRARAGALSVPHRRGGGAAFGPTPRTYTVKVNRKARRRALRAALSVHAARGSVAVLDGASFDEPATKQAAQALAEWGARSPALVVLDAEEVGALKSFRNIPRVTVVGAGAVDVADLMAHASLIVSKRALELLAVRAADVKRGSGEEPDKAGADSSDESERSEDSE